MKLVILWIVFVAVLVAGEPDKDDKSGHKEDKTGHMPPPPPPQPGHKEDSAGEPSSKVASASMPRPFFECDTQVDNPKYFNETCSNNTECFGGELSMICKNGICTCNDNYVVEERFLGEAAAQKICVTAPYLFAPCVTICQKPFVCKTYEGSTSKACQCEAPYKLVDSVCFLVCKDGETYEQNLAKCVPKCKSNEVKINSTCKPQADVGSACEIDLQCVAAYSECKDKKCVCRSGFSAKDGACVADSANCPTGDALKGDGHFGFKRCFLSSTSIDDKKPPPPPLAAQNLAGSSSKIAPPPFIPPSSELKDNCPDSHFCLITGGEFYTANADGICCPKLKLTCPFGTPSTKHSCNPSPGGEYCPSETHYCYGMSVGPSSNKQVCCPKECGHNTVSVKGKCLPQATLNEACVADEQCTDNNAGCIKGFCKCANGSKEAGSHLYKYCTRECKDSEVLYNSNCYSILSLGDSCEGQDWRCPTNAYCNKNKLCACQCGMFTLGKDTCAPAPSCPRPSFGLPMFATEAKGIGGAPPPPPTISEEKKKELLKNVTFCPIKGKRILADVKVVDSCSKSQYCAFYLHNLGICCTIPEAKCPDGSKPVSDKPCDIANPLSCGEGNTCNQYLSPADPDSTAGRMCCKAFQFNPLPPQK